MFGRAGLSIPVNVMDTTALFLITSLLQQIDCLHVMPLEVAQYYASLQLWSGLPIALPGKMDAFGIIRQQDQRLSPGRELLLKTVPRTAKSLYEQ